MLNIFLGVLELCAIMAESLCCNHLVIIRSLVTEKMY